MSLLRKSFLLLTATALIQAPLQAGIFGWAPWTPPSIQPKSDLRILAVYPSPTWGKLRIVLENGGAGTSNSCHMLAINWNGKPLSVIDVLPKLAPGEVLVNDVFYYTTMYQPGSVIRVELDQYDAVPETNESNNIAYYVSPPW